MTWRKYKRELLKLLRRLHLYLHTFKHTFKLLEELIEKRTKRLLHNYPLGFFIVAVTIAFSIPILIPDHNVVSRVFSTLSDASFLGIVLTMVFILLSLRKEEDVERAFRVKIVVLFSIAVFLFIAVKMLLSIYSPENMFLVFLIILCWSFIVATIMHIIYFLTRMDIERVLDYTYWVLVIASTAVIIIPLTHLLTAITFHRYSALAEIGMEFLRTLFIVAILIAIITLGFYFFLKQIQVKPK